MTADDAASVLERLLHRRAVRLEALLLGDCAVPHDVHIARHALHEVLVVTHQYDPPLEALHGVRQRRHRFQVEVVGGLVEHQQVRLRERSRRESDARPLTAAQRARGRALLRGGDAHRREVRAHLALVRRAAVAGEFLQHKRQRRFVKRQLVGVVLVDQRDARASVEGRHPAGGIELPQKHFHQSGLALAVLAQQTHAARAVEGHVDVREERLVARRVPERNLLQSR
mmetsp:Transcript_9196/g.38957  ORF Transcript_9196/g.38957 Transcript_9196/m.38957 type:complete len:227 (+) Transcript_9196:864-1544(+)